MNVFALDIVWFKFRSKILRIIRLKASFNVFPGSENALTAENVNCFSDFHVKSFNKVKNSSSFQQSHATYRLSQSYQPPATHSFPTSWHYKFKKETFLPLPDATKQEKQKKNVLCKSFQSFLNFANKIIYAYWE